MERDRGKTLSRREFLRIGALTAAGLAVAACAPSAEPERIEVEVTKEVPVDQTVEVEVEVPVKETVIVKVTEVPPAPEPIEIVVSCHHTKGPDVAGAKAQDVLGEAYQDVSPNTTIVWEPGGGPGGYATWLSTQLAAGDVRADFVSGVWESRYTGYVDLERYRFTENPHTGRIWDEDIDLGINKLGNMRGERYMVCPRLFVHFWLYNKELFDKAGAPEPNIDGPTWDEYLDIADKLKTDGTTPIGINFTYQANQWFIAVYFEQYRTDWVETVRAQPGDWNYDPGLDGQFEYEPWDDHNIHSSYTYNGARFLQGIRDGVLRFDTPEVAEQARNMAAAWPTYANEDMFVRGDAYPLFIQQEVAMVPAGTGWMPSFTQDMEGLTPERLEALGIETDVSSFEWGIFHRPTMEGPLKKGWTKNVQGGAGQWLSILDKTAEKTDAGVDFLMFWMSKAGYEPFHRAEEEEDAAECAVLRIRDVEDSAKNQELLKDVRLLGTAECTYQHMLYFGTIGVNPADYAQRAKDTFKDTLEGNLTPDEFATFMQATWDENFDAIAEENGISETVLDNPALRPD